MRPRYEINVGLTRSDQIINMRVITYSIVVTSHSQHRPAYSKPYTKSYTVFSCVKKYNCLSEIYVSLVPLKICCPFGRAGSSPAIRTIVVTRRVCVKVPAIAHRSVPGRLSAIAQRFGNMNASGLFGMGQVGNGSGNA